MILVTQCYLHTSWVFALSLPPFYRITIVILCAISAFDVLFCITVLNHTLTLLHLPFCVVYAPSARIPVYILICSNVWRFFIQNSFSLSKIKMSAFPFIALLLVL